VSVDKAFNTGTPPGPMLRVIFRSFIPDGTEVVALSDSLGEIALEGVAVFPALFSSVADALPLAVTVCRGLFTVVDVDDATPVMIVVVCEFCGVAAGLPPTKAVGIETGTEIGRLTSCGSRGTAASAYKLMVEGANSARLGCHR